MTAKMSISPAEHTAKETLEIRFLASDVNLVCASMLEVCHSGDWDQSRETGYLCCPVFTSPSESTTSGRSRASPGKAAVQNVNAPWEDLGIDSVVIYHEHST